MVSGEHVQATRKRRAVGSHQHSKRPPCWLSRIYAPVYVLVLVHDCRLPTIYIWAISIAEEADPETMMEGATYFLFVYLLGGLTLLPLLVVAVLIHAYVTFPVRDIAVEAPAKNALLRPGDRAETVRSASKGLEEKFQSRGSQESDVAAGYFAVCREYVPGGINGKPPERTTPTGSTVVTSPSPSVYQSMYRSIFDRKKDPGPLDNKGSGKPPNKGGNVFYVVLRYGSE